MLIGNFLAARQKVFDEIHEQVTNAVCCPVHETEQFLPVALASGGIAQVGVKVPFEPIKYSFQHYDAEWSLATGNVSPITPYPADILDVMDNVNDFVNSHPEKNVNDFTNQD